eukprot:2558413-Lingulodinium_polyedra.AAC.1
MQHLVSLLPKIPGATHLRDFRPIGVLPVLYKWYSRCLQLLAGDVSSGLSRYQFAFRPGRAAHDVVATLRWLCEKALEWPGRMRLVVLDGDIRKAYDYCRHSQVLRGAEAASLPPVLVSAWIREIRNMSAVVLLDSRVRSRRVRRRRSLVQGDPAAPM